MARKQKPGPPVNPTKPDDTSAGLFLGSLGAYGKFIDNGRERVSEIKDRRAELFDDLVKRGTRVERDAQRKLQQLDQGVRTNLDERLRAMRESFNALKDALGLAGRAKPKA